MRSCLHPPSLSFVLLVFLVSFSARIFFSALLSLPCSKIFNWTFWAFPPQLKPKTMDPSHLAPLYFALFGSFNVDPATRLSSIRSTRTVMMVGAEPRFFFFSGITLSR